MLQLHQIHPLLAKFSVLAMGIILQTGTLLHLEPGQILYQKQDLDLKVFMIIYGSFKISEINEEIFHQLDKENSQDAASVDNNRDVAPFTAEIVD